MNLDALKILTDDSWVAEVTMPDPQITLPWNLMAMPGEVCGWVHPFGYVCTRLAFHGRRHHATIARQVLAVWNEKTEVRAIR